MLSLILPYPPSVNSYWGFKGSSRYLTPKAKIFKELVWLEFVNSHHKGFGEKRLSITVYLSPPDKRRRDIDNPIKALLDALCQAKAFNDDSQIDKLYIFREPVIKGGMCKILIE
jgi:crossover junction endodeoxyribonuclease RusA